MIEKLPFETKETEYEGRIFTAKVHTNPYDMQVKINELVHAVNNQQIQLNNHECRLLDLQNRVAALDDPTYHEAEPAENGKSSKMENVAENRKCAKNAQDETPRCPFCGEELFYVQEIDGGFDILTCNCPAGFWLFGNDKMWYNLEKTTKELELTRKALDVAVDALKKLEEKAYLTEYAQGVVAKALKEITALEQKDK